MPGVFTLGEATAEQLTKLAIPDFSIANNIENDKIWAEVINQ